MELPSIFLFSTEQFTLRNSPLFVLFILYYSCPQTLRPLIQHKFQAESSFIIPHSGWSTSMYTKRDSFAKIASAKTQQLAKEKLSCQVQQIQRFLSSLFTKWILAAAIYHPNAACCLQGNFSNMSQNEAIAFPLFLKTKCPTLPHLSYT